ncbi:DUF2723 domain-containing protein [Deltaproteobacteria bacterium]|nr:DUF2723 domain-containing protein [Deltaproteobacteria bacterium]
MDIYFSKRHIPFILVIIPFIIYLSTICPTVYLGDSGELAAAAFSLGIPHPSGYPLYSLLGKLFCLIPIGNIGFRMNLMSIIFSLGTVWLVYNIIYKITSSIASAVFGAFTLAFTPLFWGQTVSAEVYPLHIFFVALLTRLLIYWDENRDLCRLALIAFIAGLSFLNHLQTVMIIPPVLLFLFLSDRKMILNLKAVTIVSILFLFALTVYFYLPIRTQAGAAIHWGDPDNLKSFFDVVSGKSHRSSYVFSKSITDYIIRSKDAFIIVVKQFGVISLFAVWGFINLPLFRWKMFYLGIIVFDCFYTIFLNTVFIEVTPFNLPTLIVIAILAGIGISDLLKRCRSIIDKSNAGLFKIANIACCAVPLVLLASNYNRCDQSRNYIAYENTVNIFRTINYGGTVFIDGDNNLFPIIYNRIVERMREDVILYDRYYLFFKIPYMGDINGSIVYHGKWDDLRDVLEKKVIEKKTGHGVYYSLFNPFLIPMPENYTSIPYGMLLKVVNDRIKIDQSKRARIWNYYATESLEDTFYLDYMNREVTANYHLNKGKHFIMLGGVEAGLQRLKLASQIGYNDDLIHTELSVLLTDFGFFDEAKKELEKSLLYYQNLAGVYNNWGYYYSKLGDLGNAIDSFNKAIDLDPNDVSFYNNLGFILLDAGRQESAIKNFHKSLSIDSNQLPITRILKELDLTNGDRK